MFEVSKRLPRLASSPAGREWLRALPGLIQSCAGRWSLRLDDPYPGSNVSLVFPAVRSDGTLAALKIQFPHRESEHEAEALQRWSGNGAVRLFEADAGGHAILMERCEPGDRLSSIQPEAAVEILMDLLPRLWIEAAAPFASLSDEAAEWASDLPVAWERAGRPFERALLDAALEALHDLPSGQGVQVLIHQDLHGGNVLRASREPWLAIDPKPLVGEREFALAPIVRAYELGHSRASVVARLDRFAAALRLDRERARRWSFAQTLAWAFEDGRVLRRHVETARWLWQG